MRIDIAACTDRQFVMPTGVMMQSVCVNNPDVDIMFHVILDENVKAGARTWYKYQDMTKWKGIKYEHRTTKQHMRRFVGNVLRMLRLLPPLQQNRRFLDVAPID